LNVQYPDTPTKAKKCLEPSFFLDWDNSPSGAEVSGFHALAALAGYATVQGSVQIKRTWSLSRREVSGKDKS